MKFWVIVTMTLERESTLNKMDIHGSIFPTENLNIKGLGFQSKRGRHATIQWPLLYL